jgi:hypothetical protein
MSLSLDFAPTEKSARTRTRPTRTLGASSSASLLIFGAELLKLCPHRGEPLFERGDDVSADLVRSEGDLVYEPTPAIDLIFGAKDHFNSAAIHGEDALGLLDLPRQLIDGHGLIFIPGMR